jgi:hypothetical protein
MLKELGMFLLWWATSSLLTIGILTTFLTFYKGGVLQLNFAKLADKKDK